MSFASMPLFTGDYLRDTRHLSPLRHGVYLLALMHCWDSKGPIPLDEQEAAGICNCRSADEIEALRYVTDRYFTRMDDGHYNKRIAEEVAKAERWGQKSRVGGLHSAETRRSKARRGAALKAIEPPFNHPSTTIPTVVQGPSVSPSPSPSPSLTPSPALSGVAPPDPPAPPALSGQPARKRAVKPTAQTGDVWSAYSQAYKERYQVEPVRNAKVNGQLAQLVARLGADEAPGVARAYLDNRNGLYVSSKHCVDLLLRDAEKLRTEWATGNVTHRGDAAQADRMGSVGNQAARVTAILDKMGVK